MTTINSGLMFRRKYESDQNAVRRFLIANEGFTKSDYKHLCGNSLSLESFTKLVKKTQTTKYWITNTWLYSRSWHKQLFDPSYFGNMNPYQRKQCPLCAAELFHSYIYSYKWVRHCPIHNVELTDHCPECGKPWPEYFNLVRNNCPNCGTVRPKILDSRRRQIKKHTNEQVATLGLFWSLVHLDRFFCRVLYSDYVGHGWDSGILVGSKEFPELAMTLYPKHLKLFRMAGVNSASSLKEIRFGGKPITAADLKMMPVNKPSYAGFIKGTVNEMDLEIRLALGISTKIEEDQYRPSRHVYVDCMDDYNVNEVAYDVWRSIVEKSDNKVTSTSWWMRIFEILTVPQPESPAVVNLVISNDGVKYFDPSDEFRVWMYKMHLKNLFIYIYKHTLLLKLILTNHYPSSDRDINDRNWLLWPHRYNWFRVRILANNQLQIVYRNFPAWPEVLDINNLKRELVETYDSITNPVATNSACWGNTFGRYLTASRAKNIYDCIRNIPVYNKSQWGKHLDRKRVPMQW